MNFSDFTLNGTADVNGAGDTLTLTEKKTSQAGHAFIANALAISRETTFSASFATEVKLGTSVVFSSERVANIVGSDGCFGFTGATRRFEQYATGFELQS